MLHCITACGKTESERDTEPPASENSEESSDTGGASPGSGGRQEAGGSGGVSSSGSGGASATGGTGSSPEGCPSLVPDAEDDCQTGTRCTYPSSLDTCGAPLLVDASCDDGFWVIERPVSCSPSAPCSFEPGVYELSTSANQGLGGSDAVGCLDPDAEPTRSFEIVERDSTLHVRGSWDVVTSDECELELTYFSTYETDLELEVDTESLFVRFGEQGFVDARLVQEDSCGGRIERAMVLAD